MFQLPIQYNLHNEVDPTIIQDLELVSTVDPANKPVYHKVFNPSTDTAKEVVTQMSKYYTNNTLFLKDNIVFNKRFSHTTPEYSEFINHWKQLNNNEEFKLTYQYLTYDRLSWLNESSKFMFAVSLYFIASPVLFIASPIMMLILPFALIKLQGHDISWELYKTKLYEVTKKHAIVNLVSNFSTADQKEKLMLVSSAAIFVVQTYCNGYAVYNFYKNIYSIHSIIDCVQSYIKQNLESIEYIKSISSDLSTYKGFLLTLEDHQSVLSTYYDKIKDLKQFTYSWNEFIHLGNLRAHFYELYSNKELKNSLNYSIQLCGYLENMQNLSNQLRSKNLNACTYSKKTSFSDAYYPTEKPIKNSYKLNKNIIITGPNASGKTTFIKMTLINTLLSQQIGCGFYKKANIYPYDSFCSYINIPDTSGRDSLFQAEARRCKQVIDTVKNNKRVFCIFDELFSGTNPKEASASAFAFLQYISIVFCNINEGGFLFFL